MMAEQKENRVGLGPMEGTRNESDNLQVVGPVIVYQPAHSSRGGSATSKDLYFTVAHKTPLQTETHVRESVFTMSKP
jgi:hypothetical protein